MKKLTILFGLFCNFAFADIINFNTNSNNLFPNDLVIADSFVFTEMGQSMTLGTAMNDIPLVVSNGTVHLIDWAGAGMVSFMRMNAVDQSAFSLSAFDFSSGYLDGSNMAGVLFVRGFDANGVMTGMERFNGADFTFNAFTTLSLGAAFENVSFVTFMAQGPQNRVGYDNFVVNQVVSVSEPASLAILLAGMAGVMLKRRKTA